MVSFKEVVTAADAEAIRQYVLKRANEDKALESRTAARPAPRAARLGFDTHRNDR